LPELIAEVLVGRMDGFGAGQQFPSLGTTADGKETLREGNLRVRKLWASVRVIDFRANLNCTLK
jgi:hypothetical protein